MPEVTAEENKFLKWLVPILIAALFGMVVTHYYSDQTVQDKNIADLTGHESQDRDKFDLLTKELSRLNANVYQLCIKTQTPCQTDNLTMSLAHNK